jgi:glycosyltransferase involved in cell wall biosynthesis
MLFSVIVAHYENARYLPDLVRSMQDQTHADWELVIVDDHSTVDPYSWLEPFMDDKRITYARHGRNLGAAAAFRTAADLSKGGLIGMLGADDALVPQALQRMVRAHDEHPDASLVNSACFRCDEALRILEVYRHYRPLRAGESLIRDVCIGSFATFKREAYLKTEGFDPYFRRALDHDIYLKLDEVGNLVFVEEPLYLYRTNPIGISQFGNGILAAQYSLMARYRAYRRRIGTAKENLTTREARAILQTWYLRELQRQAAGGNVAEVRTLIRRALREAPGLCLERAFWGHVARSLLRRIALRQPNPPICS